MPRNIFGLLVVIALSCFVSALFTIFNLWAVAIFTSIGFGAAGAAKVLAIADQEKGVEVVAFISFLVVSTGGIISIGMTDHALWSIKTSGIALDEAQQHPYSTLFYFREGRARPDLMETADIMGSTGKGRAHRIDTAFVVPIVPEDWTPDRPVHVWGVSKRENYLEQVSNWHRSVRGGARTVGLNVSDYQNAIDWAKQAKHLVSSEDPLLIELSAQPEDLIMATWSRLGWIIAITFFSTMFMTFIGIAFHKGEKAGMEQRKIYKKGREK